MIGTYKTSDDSIYEVTEDHKAAGKAKGEQYVARCIKSDSGTKSNAPFIISKQNLLRNTLYNLWIKIK